MAEITYHYLGAEPAPGYLHGRRHRRARGIAHLSLVVAAVGLVLTSLTAIVAGVGPAPREDHRVELAMAVKPGDPVPMRIVTEKSKGEFSGKGYTGQGIDVALIDSGVTPVHGLHQPGKILYGPDLSNEGAYPNLTNLDTYGHGTHLAGIIAGDDGDQVGGIAPDSRIVSVKVADASGAVDITQVIAGIDWVVDHRNDQGLNIRVLNLSLGTDGIKTSDGDVLSAAVERAWEAGIVVVAAAGNRGNDAGGIDSPAISPYVIAVGAHESYDSSGAQDWIAPWTSGGNEYREPDFVAPGRSIMSFRVPGSMLDVMHPHAVVHDKYFLGSGSSQSAAVVSGFAAALLSRYPSLDNDQVKYLFELKSVDFKEVPSTVDGAGKFQPKESVRAAEKEGPKAPAQKFPPALAPDGSDGVMAPTGSTWSGGQWNGASWSGGTWSGASWSGADWSGASWSGSTWSGASWSGASWSGASWSGASWSGASWSGASWSGSTWSGEMWSGIQPSSIHLAGWSWS